MTDAETRRPPFPTCEDWDEDAETTLPGPHASADVSTKRSQQDLVFRHREGGSRNNGGDSGYASRADTLASDSSTSSRRKLGLKVDTAAVPERERKPYLISHASQTKPPSRRQSSSHGKDIITDTRPVKSQHELHDRGTCWVCDQYGRHIDIRKDMSRASSAAPPPPPPPAANRNGGSKISKDDDAIPHKSRRPSSGREPRPLSMLSTTQIPIQFINPAAYGPPAVATSGWTTPVTPSMPYSPLPFSYAPTTPVLPTPSYMPFQQMPYFEPPLGSEPRSAKTSRRSSPVRRPNGYGDPVIRQGYQETGMVPVDRISSRENRPPLASQRSARTVEHDRSLMPPPPRPPPSEVVLPHRPGARRSKSYHPQEMSARDRFSFEPQRYDDEEDDFDYRPVRVHPPTIRERRESPSRPPTSYRAPAMFESRDRPVPRKSVSYSAGTTTTKVASSYAHAVPRRTTLPSVPLEQKEANAEEYQKKSGMANDLTVEALRDLDNRNSGSRSETGSSFSRQSSSKDSSGRGRSQTSGTKTSITFPGGVNMTIPPDYMAKDGRPLSLNIGGLVLSVGPEGKEVERVKEQKRIERAPSVNSRASKKSASSSVVSREKDRDPGISTTSSRRPSRVEGSVPSVRPSQQHSRAPSVNGRSYDYSQRRSVDYANGGFDEVYGV